VFDDLATKDMVLAVGTAVAVLVTFIMLFVVMQKDAKHRLASERLKRHSTLADSDSVFGSAPVTAAELVAHTIGKVGTSLKLIDADTGSEIEQKFTRAGLRNSSARATFLGSRLGLFVVGLFLAFILHSWVFESQKLHMTIFMYLVFAAAGYYLPVVVLDYMVKKRQSDILKSLPDALDMLIVCIESGMGFDQAIYRISEEIKHGHRALSNEFELMLLELRAGRGRTDALKSLSDRVGILELNNLVTLIIQSDIFGTSIAQSLRIYSDIMRTQRFQRAEELAMKLPVKLLFPLVAFILPPLFMIIMGPAVIQISRVFGK
jgi:tight adherence protein C